MSLLSATGDALIVAKRNLIKIKRVPDLLVFTTLSPIMFVLLFAYVFGGAIDKAGGGAAYREFLIAGIFAQTVIFGATITGAGLAEDVKKGIIDRFRSLPMARSAVLAGRTLSDTVRNMFVVLLMTAVGMAVGFRFHGGILEFAAALLLGVLFGLAFSWISALISLAAGNVEAAQASSFVWIFPLTFASSAFVPVRSMPGWLQAWAKVNPVSITVDALRSLSLGQPLAHQVVGGSTTVHVLESLAWIAGILLVFVPLAVLRYRKTT